MGNDVFNRQARPYLAKQEANEQVHAPSGHARYAKGTTAFVLWSNVFGVERTSTCTFRTCAVCQRDDGVCLVVERFRCGFLMM